MIILSKDNCVIYGVSVYGADGLCFCVAGQDEEAVKRLTESAGTKSELAKPVQELIRMIFDVESMKKAMVEFEVTLQP